jgi:bifunctional UDP-N-acetylglucosamine pyrophosphorylase/glucosamine-1-phosphate N-acetyltransferase
MKKGVTIKDPSRFDVRGSVHIDKDVEIDINVILEGKVIIGKYTKIGANTIIMNSIIGENVTILPNTIIDGANILNNCVVGPFARIRPDTYLDEDVKIGNFVEIKKAKIKRNTKINHLSYIGDAKVGRDVIVGAGTITCNYDGANKNTTVIEDNAFIGSDTQLVAPVKIGKNSTIGAGSTITKNTSKNTLVFCKIERKEIKNWVRPKKKIKK